MERTKKLPESTHFGDVKVKRKEFLVPSPTENGVLIGINSGKVYTYGMICYTGKEVFLSDIMDKMKANKIDIPDGNAYQLVLGHFIDELYRYKIGNIITGSQDSRGDILLMKAAENERAALRIPVNKTDSIRCHDKGGLDKKGEVRQMEKQQEGSHKLLSKEEKKLLLKQWKASQNKKYMLSKAKVQKLFHYLEVQLAGNPCNHTLHFTGQWLEHHLPPEKIGKVIAQIKGMGGYCDCEVLFNCYETYGSHERRGMTPGYSGPVQKEKDEAEKGYMEQL